MSQAPGIWPRAPVRSKRFSVALGLGPGARRSELAMMNRRVFLKNGSLALVSLGFAPSFINRTVQAARARQKVLVAIFQRGAVDGLNMIVPHGEKAYYAARPSIAIPRPNQQDGAVDLDGFFGLHPRMAPLEPFFKRGELAIV